MHAEQMELTIMNLQHPAMRRALMAAAAAGLVAGTLTLTGCSSNSPTGTPSASATTAPKTTALSASDSENAVKKAAQLSRGIALKQGFVALGSDHDYEARNFVYDPKSDTTVVEQIIGPKQDTQYFSMPGSTTAMFVFDELDKLLATPETTFSGSTMDSTGVTTYIWKDKNANEARFTINADGSLASFWNMPHKGGSPWYTDFQYGTNDASAKILAHAKK